MKFDKYHRFDDYAKVRQGWDFCLRGHYLHEDTIVGRLWYFNTYVSQRGNRMCDVCYNALGKRERYTSTLCYLEEREWRIKYVHI